MSNITTLAGDPLLTQSGFNITTTATGNVVRAIRFLGLRIGG